MICDLTEDVTTTTTVWSVMCDSCDERGTWSAWWLLSYDKFKGLWSADGHVLHWIHNISSLLDYRNIDPGVSLYSLVQPSPNLPYPPGNSPSNSIIPYLLNYSLMSPYGPIWAVMRALWMSNWEESDQWAVTRSRLAMIVVLSTNKWGVLASSTTDYHQLYHTANAQPPVSNHHLQPHSPLPGDDWRSLYVVIPLQVSECPIVGLYTLESGQGHEDTPVLFPSPSIPTLPQHKELKWAPTLLSFCSLYNDEYWARTGQVIRPVLQPTLYDENNIFSIFWKMILEKSI